MSRGQRGHHEPHHASDEYLELLYHLRERHQVDRGALADHLHEAVDEELLRRLAADELLLIDGEQLELTEAGFRRAEQIIRRHRLAERLLTDVLHMSPADVERSACEFEHMVAEEITESICILLGHPRTCPHGSPIPPGPCCTAAARACEAAVVPLTEVPLGAAARVAYVNATSDERHHRLTHFGIVPGSMIRLHQRKPSVVVNVDSARLAMEDCIARDIFVWKKWYDQPSQADGEPSVTQRRSRLQFWRR